VDEVKRILGLPQTDVNFAMNYHNALRGGHDTIVALLLAHPDIDVNVKDSNDASPFVTAFYSGHISCVREMLKDSRVKVNEPDKYGATPLRRAASSVSLDVIKWWIASGREMDLGKPGDVDKTDAIGGAKKYGKTETAILLERFKSDAAKTRSEVRKELGINGQYSSYYSILFLFLFLFLFPFSVNDLLPFFPPPFFHSQFLIVKDIDFFFSSLLCSLSL